MGKHLPTIVLASYLILRRGEEVLLAKRINTGYWDEHYGLPAGHVESRESASLALAREMQEEIGITLQTEALRLVHVIHRKSEDGSERVDFFFEGNTWEGEIKNNEPEKCGDLTWVSLEELPENTIPYIRETLARVHQGAFYHEEGW